MTVCRSRTFRSGNSEAVRLPRDGAFGQEVEPTIVRSGDVLTIYPARPAISEILRKLALTPRPDSVEVRDEDLLPEREGL